MENIKNTKTKGGSMKKLLMGLFLAVAVFNTTCKAQALPDQISANEYSGNTLVKSTPGAVFSVNVTYIGVTAGDYIKLIDSLTSSGAVRFTCVASATSGTCGGYLTVANYFGTAILYTEQKSGGTFKTDIQYF